MKITLDGVLVFLIVAAFIGWAAHILHSEHADLMACRESKCERGEPYKDPRQGCICIERAKP